MMLKILFEGFDFATGGSLQQSIDSDLGSISALCREKPVFCDTLLLFKYDG